MDEEEIWLSDGVDEEEQRLQSSQDPSAFDLALTYEGGLAGGYHIRNRPGERQRMAVSAFQGGSRKKPAFTVSCYAKAMIHGAIEWNYGKRATLLVYELKFLSRRGTRIKEADILFQFMKGPENSQSPEVVVSTSLSVLIMTHEDKPLSPRTATFVEVEQAIRPNGVFKMEETLEHEESNGGLSFNISPGIPGVDAGVTLSGEQSRSKEKKHYTTIIGETPPDLDFGYHTDARFRLEENPSQKTGIPTTVTVAILLEREDDEDFAMMPYIEATPNFRFTSLISSLSSSRSSDDPILFSVKEPTVNQLHSSVTVNKDNLGAVNLDCLWDCTLFNIYEEAVKKIQLRRET